MPGSVLGFGDTLPSTTDVLLCLAVLSKDGGLLPLCTQTWFIACLVRPSYGWTHILIEHTEDIIAKSLRMHESIQDGLNNNNNNRHSLYSSQHSSLTPNMCLPFFGIWQTSIRPGSTTDPVTLNKLLITLSFHFLLCERTVSIVSYLIRLLGGLSEVLHAGNLTKWKI